MTGVHRQVFPLARLSLTDICIEKLPKNAKQKNLIKCFKEQSITEKWEATPWAKKLAAKKKRASLNDFGRFQVMIAKKQKAEAVKKAM